MKRKYGGQAPGAPSIRFSPSAKTLLKKLALRAKVNGEIVDSRHLLLALLEMEHEIARPFSAIEILRVLKVDLNKLERELLHVQDSEIDIEYTESNLALSGTNIVELFDDSTVLAILFAQRKAWEEGTEAVELRHVILGLMHADATIADLFRHFCYESPVQKGNIEFFGVTSRETAPSLIPFLFEVNEILEQSGSLRGPLKQLLVSPKLVLLTLLLSPEAVLSEGLEKLVDSRESLANVIASTPGAVLPTPGLPKVDASQHSNSLPKLFDPTDDAITLEQKIAAWESEADLCRRVEKEAMLQAELCRQALSAIMLDDDSE